MIPRRPYGPARLPISFQAATHIISKRLACNVHYSAMNLAGYEPSFVAVIPQIAAFVFRSGFSANGAGLPRRAPLLRVIAAVAAQFPLDVHKRKGKRKADTPRVRS